MVRKASRHMPMRSYFCGRFVHSSSSSIGGQRQDQPPIVLTFDAAIVDSQQ